MNSQPTILQKIFKQKQIRVEEAKKGFDYKEFVTRAENFSKTVTRNRFLNAFNDKTRINIIAEIKVASPSKGVIKEKVDVCKIAKTYEKFGAAAISVLTEEDNFGGSVDSLLTARNLTNLPILRKDFIFDEFQIYESLLICADAILLIVSMLDDESLHNLHSLATDLGLDVLVEIHDLEELERATKLGAKIIGVNNRNLHTFEVSLDNSRKLIKYAPENVVMITESGLKTKEDLKELKDLGFRGFLIGESLMRAENTGEMLKSLLGIANDSE